MQFRSLFRTLLLSFILSITACGGEGSNGENTDDDEPDSSLEVTEAPGKQLNTSGFKLTGYSGNENRAKLNLSNARDFAKNALYAADIVHIYSRMILTARISPTYLRYPGYRDQDSDDDVECDAEKFYIEDDRNETTGLGNYRAIFNNCVSDGVTINGELTFDILEIDEMGEPKVYTLSIGELKFASDEYQHSLKLFSEVTVNGWDYRIVSDILLEDRENVENASIHQQYGKDLVIDYSYEESLLSGRVYQNKSGYFDIGTNEDDYTIRMTAADETFLDLAFLMDNDGDHYFNNVKTISMDLYLGVEPHQNFHTDVSSEQFYDDGDEKNSTPELIVQDKVSIDRSQTAEVSAAQSLDPESDFLQANWRVIESPDECEHQLEKVTSHSIHLFSFCPGKYQLGVSLSDGFSFTEEKMVSVEFLKLEPVVKEITALEASGSDVFSKQIEVENPADGPFSYSIAYGPSGMSIDDNGLLTYQPRTIIHQPQTEINFGIEINNGKSVTYSSKLIWNSESARTTEIEVLSDCDFGSLIDQGNEEIQRCLAKESDTPQFYLDSALNLSEPFFNSTDNSIEFYITGHTDLDSNTYQYSIDLNSRKILSKNLGLAVTDPQQGIDYFKYDMNGDGADELFVKDRNINEYQVLDLNNEQLLAPTHIGLDLLHVLDSKIKRLNNDGDRLFISNIGSASTDQSFYVINLEDQSIEWTYPLNRYVYDFEVTDLDGDGIDEIIFLSRVSILTQITLNVYRKENGVYRQYMEEEIDVGVGVYNRLGVQNIDNDNKLEIIVAGQASNSEDKSIVYFIDDNLTFLPKIELNAEIGAIPSLAFNESTRNFIAVVNDDKERVSYFAEFDVASGHRIWNSPKYTGIVSRNQAFLLGDDVYLHPKLIRTSNRIYIIE